jgi:hypothetical protein
MSKQPPLPGKKGNGTVSLEVIDVLKGGDGHNAQVFTVRLMDCESTSHMLPQKGTRLVAKVYDPLYSATTKGTSTHSFAWTNTILMRPTHI